MRAEPARRPDRLTLVLLVAAFFGPLLLAVLLYAFGDVGHGARVNRGTLLDPPRPIAGAAGLGLDDAWTLVVLAPGGCDAACAATLLVQRQVRLSFGHDAERIGRALVSGRADADRAALAAAHPDLKVLDAVAAGAVLEAIGPAAPGQGFVVDPLGNAMLAYAAGTPPADLKADLKRLLKNSQGWMRR